MDTKSLEQMLVRIAIDHQTRDIVGFIEEVNEAFKIAKHNQVIWNPDQPVDERSTR